MKKVIMVVLALAMILSMAACGEQVKQPLGVDDSNIQIVNPFTECDTLDNAAEIAGFEMSTPTAVPNWVDDVVIRAVENEMIEMIYTGTDQQELRVRKANGNEDVSGVYESFDEVKEVSINGQDVTLKINKGQIYVAIWTEDSYCYAVSTMEGLDQIHIENLVSGIN